MSDNKVELITRIATLESEIQRLKRAKTYGLVWEDKPEDVVVQCKANIPVLKEVKTRKIVTDESLPTNLLIEGDNYHSLSVLNYTHRGGFDVIYADPPYNTGNKSWRYNNDYIEKDDGFRHSKWISYIEKRLRLSRSLLKDDGVIVVTIDDYEIGTLRLLLDEIFGEDNRLGLITIMHNPRGRSDDQYFATSHEYALFYGKNPDKAITYKLDLTQEQRELFPLTDEFSNYRLLPLKRTGSNSTPNERPKLYYPIFANKKSGEISIKERVGKDWLVIEPKDSTGAKRVWRWGKEKVQREWKTELIAKFKNDKCSIFTKDRIKEGRKPKTIWVDPKYDASSHGTVLLENILGERKVFDYPKSLYAVIDTLKILTKEKRDASVLDFFAGSGTTGHAVFELNKQDGGNRRFVLCTNNENNICEEVTHKRLEHVIKGYKDKGGQLVKGLGGDLRYYKTDLVSTDKLQKISDEARIKVTYQAGEMIALREDTLTETEKNDWWQIFEDHGRMTAIYFKEDKAKLSELVAKLEQKNIPVALYIFSWGKNEYRGELGSGTIRVEDIPEPILEVYKEINRL
ncbi:MAG: site-specific DNA-methyltransferase [Patescibacteria group bacterium]